MDGYHFLNRSECPACSGTLKVKGLRSDRRQGFWIQSGIFCSIVQCQKCGLVFPNPMPVPLSADSLYDLSSPDYFKQKKQRMDRVAKTLMDWTGRSSDATMRILEVGSGLGELAKALSDLGHEVTGLEPSPSFFSQAVQKTGPTFRQEIFESSGVEGPFDLVFFVAVFEHFADLCQVLEKTYALLRPGGQVLIVNVPNARFWKTQLINLALFALMKPFVVNCSPLHSPFHLYEFTPKSLKRLLVKAGFTADRIWVETGHNYRFTSLYRLASFWAKTLGTGEIIRVLARKPE